ncbi:hypothetical protein JCM17960_07910 [Magnetospira thiophila]
MIGKPTPQGSQGAQTFILLLAVALVLGVLILVIDALLHANDLRPTGTPRLTTAQAQHAVFTPQPLPPFELPPIFPSLGGVTLSEREVLDLVYMREEEKLARDVYLDLYERWQVPLFQKVATAEQRHMDAVGGMLTRYGIPDPALGSARGAFHDPHLLGLYRDLSTKGVTSLQAAFEVGGLIEEVDITDLDTALDNTQQADIRQVYRTIRRGSRNHLRAFAGQLSQMGVPYDVQLMSAQRVQRILQTPMEQGPPPTN